MEKTAFSLSSFLAQIKKQSDPTTVLGLGYRGCNKQKHLKKDSQAALYDLLLPDPDGVKLI